MPNYHMYTGPDQSNRYLCVCKAHTDIFPLFYLDGVQMFLVFFPHHLFVESACKQVRPHHISDGVSHCPVQQRIVLSEQNQANSAVCLPTVSQFLICFGSTA